MFGAALACRLPLRTTARSIFCTPTFPYRSLGSKVSLHDLLYIALTMYGGYTRFIGAGCRDVNYRDLNDQHLVPGTI
jgi:hypothetical protein